MKNRIDAVKVIGISTIAKTGEPSSKLFAMYALMNVASGIRFGSDTFDNWSSETMGHFAALMKSMEADIGAYVFEDAEETATTTDGAGIDALTQDDGVPGL